MAQLALLLLCLPAPFPQSELDGLIEKLRNPNTREAAADRLAELSFERDLRKELESRAAAADPPDPAAAAALRRAAAVARYRWALDDETARLLDDAFGFVNLSDTFLHGPPERRRVLLVYLSHFADPCLVPMLNVWAREIDEGNRPMLSLLRGVSGDPSCLPDLLELLKLDPMYARPAAAAAARLLARDHLPLLHPLLEEPRAAPHAWSLIDRIDPEMLRARAARMVETKEASPEMRLLAATTLAKLGDRSGVDALAEALRGERNPRALAYLVDLLSKLKPVEALPAFEEMTRHPDSAVVRLGLEGLLSIDIESAIQPLLEALGHPDQLRVAAFAISRLETIDEGWWIGPARAMIKDRSREKRANAAQLLGLSRKERYVEALVGLLADPEGYVQYRALEAIHRISPARAAQEAGKLLQAQDGFVLALAAEIVSAAEPRRTEGIYRALLASPAAYPRVTALQKLAERNVPDIAELARGFLQDPSPAVRLHGLSALLQVDASKALDPFFEIFPGLGEQAPYAWVLLERHASDPALAPRFAAEFLRSESPLPGRILAAGWLSHFGGERARAAFETALRDAPVSIRLPAAVGLARLGDHDQARPVLLELLRQPEGGESTDLFQALARCGGADVAAELERILQEGDPSAAALAAEALGRMDSRGSRRAIHRAIFSEHPRLRDAALFAAARFGSRIARTRLIRNIGEILPLPPERRPPWLGELVGYAVELGGADGMQVARSALKHGDAKLRARTLRILGEQPTREAIELIRESLQDSSTIEGISGLEIGVREVALNTLLRATKTRFSGGLDQRIKAWTDWWKAQGGSR